MTTKESEAEELVKSEGKKRKWAREDNMMASSNGGGIQRYFITLEYVGTRFLGFQKQKGMRTVQGVLEVKSFFLSSWNYLLDLLIEWEGFFVATIHGIATSRNSGFQTLWLLIWPVKLFDLMLLILFWLIFAQAAFEMFVGHPVVSAASSRTVRLLIILVFLFPNQNSCVVCSKHCRGLPWILGLDDHEIYKAWMVTAISYHHSFFNIRECVFFKRKP